MRRVLVGLAILVGLGLSALFLSPWPSVLVVRAIFDRGATTASAKLERHVPPSVSTTTVSYDPSRGDALLDIHRAPQARQAAPVVVWIHGGGFVSGRRSDITNYAKILAGRGFTVVNVDYTIAPEASYPEPVRQVNQALGFLAREGARLGIEPGRLVLAGDSAGAQIAAQTAAMISNPAYARTIGITPAVSPERIVGALLHCGVYDISGMGQDGGILGWFVQSAGWAYSGKRNWRKDPFFRTMSVAPHVTAAFPPAFISAGNADPLAPQSVALARALKARGVEVTELFFPADAQPPLGHEYQFDLDLQAGRLALERSVSWLQTL